MFGVLDILLYDVLGRVLDGILDKILDCILDGVLDWVLDGLVYEFASSSAEYVFITSLGLCKYRML